jgi:lactate dehydrogenase-like 2-hydroxyacid dehydrogenase
MAVELLQLCPMMPALEAALAERFHVHRWFDTTDKGSFLDGIAVSIRGVVTGGHVGIPTDLAAALPALEIVAINGVGFDKVDLAQARGRGYRVTNTPDILTEDVADLAIGLVLALSRRLVEGDRHVRDRRWLAGDLGLGRKVSRRRYGIVGLGRIGRAIARRLEAFDAKIGYTDRAALDVPYPFYDTLASLAAETDVLIVAAAASPETRRLIDATVIDALGPQGMLVNVARGSLVDESALVAALLAGRLGGAALDVFEDEPRVHPGLLELDNVVLTPHIASATHEAREAMGLLCVEALRAVLVDGRRPEHVVG